jgi:hypothetical protein
MSEYAGRISQYKEVMCWCFQYSPAGAPSDAYSRSIGKDALSDEVLVISMTEPHTANLYMEEKGAPLL